MKKRYLLVPLLAVIGSLFVLSFIGHEADTVASDTPPGQDIAGWEGVVSVAINGQHYYSGHNLITLNGLKYFIDRTAQDTSGPINNISVGGNTSVLAMTDTVLAGLKTTCNLVSVAPTVYAESAIGNITFSHTWTANANNCHVNTTGLFNGSVGGVLIAEAYFADANLQTNDQISVNYSVAITNSTVG